MFESLYGVLATCLPLLCVKNQTCVSCKQTWFIVLGLLGITYNRRGSDCEIIFDKGFVNMKTRLIFGNISWFYC